MYTHAQNLNEDRLGKIKGSILRHGRCWFHFGKDRCVGFEWNLFKWRGLRFDIGLAHYDCALSISVAFLFFSLHAHLDHYQLENWIQDKTKRKDETYGSGREIGFHTHEWALWWFLWSDPMCSASKDPWYVRTHKFEPREILFGDIKCSYELIAQERIKIAMPESVYEGTCKIELVTRKRPRSPFKDQFYRADMDIPKGIPHPGKGENSWDCGEDATFGLSCQASSVEEATAKLIESVLKSRRRYGGKDWVPQEFKTA